MSDHPANPNRPGRLPWSVLGTAMAAMTALWMAGGNFLGIPVFAALLIGAHAVPWRLPANSRAAWALRVIAFTIIILIEGVPQESIRLWYTNSEYTDLLGYLLCAELVVRAWKKMNPAKISESRGVVLVLTGLILTAGANTTRTFPMSLIAPVYLALIVISLRWFIAPAPEGAIVGKQERPLRVRLLAMRGVALTLAILLGMGSVVVIRRLEPSIARLFLDMIQPPQRDWSEIGLMDAPRLGPVHNPRPSTTRLLQIDGSAAVRHLRVAAFDKLEGTQWGPPVRNRPRTTVREGQLRTSARGTKLTFTLFEDVDPLPLPLDAASINVVGKLERDEMGMLANARTLSPYEVIAGPPSFQGPLCIAPGARSQSNLLAIPPHIDPQVIELAKQTAGSGDPLSRVIKLEQFLKGQNEYSLSYQPRGEPLNDFILNKRAAHCQYFASALVIMCRAAGVPARLVTGYYAHESHGPDRLIVRQRDAHAWAECWIEGRGWITADATPASALPEAAFGPPSIWTRIWEWIKDLPGNLKQWIGGLGPTGIAVLISVTCGCFGLIWAIRAWRGRRGRKPRDLPYATPGEKLVQAARRFERWLRQRGAACPANITWREHLRKLASGPEKPIDPAACMEFLDAYDEARFGGENGNASEQMGKALGGVVGSRHGKG